MVNLYNTAKIQKLRFFTTPTVNIAEQIVSHLILEKEDIRSLDPRRSETQEELKLNLTSVFLAIKTEKAKKLISLNVVEYLTKVGHAPIMSNFNSKKVTAEVLEVAKV